MPRTIDYRHGAYSPHVPLNIRHAARRAWGWVARHPRDYPEYFAAADAPLAGEKRLPWGSALLLWLTLSAVAWAILIGGGWAVLRAF